MIERRTFLLQSGAALLGLTGLPVFAQEDTCWLEPAAYEPIGRTYCLGDRFVWVGAQQCANTRELALIAQKPGFRPYVVAELAAGQSCLTDEFAGQLLITTLEGPRRVTPQDTGDLALTPESLRALEGCAAQIARQRTEIEQTGLQDLTAIAFGKPASDGGQLLLACRRTASPTASELLVLKNRQIQYRRMVDWPLALDGPILTPLPTGGWLVYPAFTPQRRQSLRTVLSGIPVGLVSENLEIALHWVPWATWNMGGEYRVWPVGQRFVVAVTFGWQRGAQLSGIYSAEGHNWYHRYPGAVDIYSLLSNPQGSALAWRETIVLDGGTRTRLRQWVERI